MNEVLIDQFFCKGCGLCTISCPVDILRLDMDALTPKGYHPAVCIDMDKCVGCASCARMCPDMAITVLREVR